VSEGVGLFTMKELFYQKVSRTSFLSTLDRFVYMWYKYWHNLVENLEASPSFISILLIFIEGASQLSPVKL